MGFNKSHIADALFHPSDKGVDIADIYKYSVQHNLSMVFCEAKLELDGWISNLSCHNALSKILEAENNNEILSNVTYIFHKK